MEKTRRPNEDTKYEDLDVAEESRQMKKPNYDTVKGKALIMFVEEEVELDAWGRDKGEVQDDDEDDEMTARFLVEHIFIAVPIDKSREGEINKDDVVVWAITTESKKEEEGGEKREEEKKEEIFGFGKLPDTYLGEVMRVK